MSKISFIFLLIIASSISCFAQSNKIPDVIILGFDTLESPVSVSFYRNMSGLTRLSYTVIMEEKEMKEHIFGYDDKFYLKYPLLQYRVSDILGNMYRLLNESGNVIALTNDLHKFALQFDTQDTCYFKDIKLFSGNQWKPKVRYNKLATKVFLIILWRSDLLTNSSEYRYPSFLLHSKVYIKLAIPICNNEE